LRWTGTGWDSLDEPELATTYLDPLEAFYIYLYNDSCMNLILMVNSDDGHPYAMPTRDLSAGWNLIGPAPAYQDGGFAPKPVEDSLITIDGNYSIVLSPGLNQPGWSYVQGDSSTDLLPYKGYWVYMNNPDTLAGFSTTPL